MKRALAVLCVAMMLVGGSAAATTIPVDDLQSFASPCDLQLDEIGVVRHLSWNNVRGAVSYKVGYRTCDGTIVGLAEVSITSFDHIGWNPLDCLEYVVVGYDLGGDKVCAAHVLDVGLDCPCP